MASDILVSETLCGGFWPSSRFGLDVEDEFMDDNTICEEYAEDAPFVGLDTIVQPHHFVLVEMCMLDTLLQCVSADGDLRPFWVARAITNPSPDPGHRNQIQIQY
jgi:hypothetical protein